MEENLTIKVKHFCEVAVLLGRWFSRPPECISMKAQPDVENLLAQPPTSSGASADETTPQATSSDGPNADEKFCYCQQREYGELVGCDKQNCVYHMECLKLKTLPRSSKWYCPDCRKLNQKK